MVSSAGKPRGRNYALRSFMGGEFEFNESQTAFSQDRAAV